MLEKVKKPTVRDVAALAGGDLRGGERHKPHTDHRPHGIGEPSVGDMGLVHRVPACGLHHVRSCLLPCMHFDSRTNGVTATLGTAQREHGRDDGPAPVFP